MPKKIKDIKIDPQIAKIDLRGKSLKKIKTFKKNKNILYKQKTPIKEVTDLSGSEKNNYLYIRGNKFNPPKFLGNIIRVAFVGFLILFIINATNVYFIGKSIEAGISSSAHEGYNYLVDAGKSATKIQLDNAIQSFDKAIENFNNAEDDIWFIKSDYSFYAKNGDLGQAITNLLEGGKYFAVAGKYFLDALEEFNKIPLYFVSKNKTESQTPPSITDSLKKGLEKTNLAIEQVSLASAKMSAINENSLPPELKARVSFAKEKVAEVAQTLEEISKHFPAILKLLGDRYPHRYLILLQNNNEIRPSGGFIGSYLIVDINDGYIENLEVNDVYDIDGSYTGVIEPPEELKAVTGNWRFRDSNYSSDFTYSAKKARWFLEKEGGPTVDTVIAINQGLLKDMLDITGPIQVGQFGKLDSENYNLLLSFVIESKAWGAEDPKHILKVFIPEFKKAILKEENISKVTSKLYKAIQQKHILMYSSDEDIQALFDSLGASGRAYQPKDGEDYLSVINISTGGTKSDQFMEEKISHNTSIDLSGGLIDEITIERSHQWTDTIYYQWKNILKQYGFDEMPDEIIDILGRGDNRVSTKIYVPDGSKLIESNGADVETKYDPDLKKTYFLTKFKTTAGETSKLWIKYKLPFTLEFNPLGTYKLVIEKQPGSRGSIFTKTMQAAGGIYNLDIYPEEAHLDTEGNVIYATNLVYDKYFSGVWGK